MLHHASLGSQLCPLSKRWQTFIGTKVCVSPRLSGLSAGLTRDGNLGTFAGGLRCETIYQALTFPFFKMIILYMFSKVCTSSSPQAKDYTHNHNGKHPVPSIFTPRPKALLVV